MKVLSTPLWMALLSFARVRVMQLALAGALMGHKQLSFARVRVMQHHLRGLTKMVLLVILRACACDAA